MEPTPPFSVTTYIGFKFELYDITKPNKISMKNRQGIQKMATAGAGTVPDGGRSSERPGRQVRTRAAHPANLSWVNICVNKYRQYADAGSVSPKTTKETWPVKLGRRSGNRGNKGAGGAKSRHSDRSMCALKAVGTCYLALGSSSQ